MHVQIVPPYFKEKIMNAQEIVNHPDFTNLIKFAIKKKCLKFKESTEEVIQNVILNILRSYKKTNLSFSTVIVQHTIWHHRETKRQRKKEIDCQELSDINNTYTDRRFDIVNDFDELEEILDIVTDRQKQVLKLLASGKSQKEAAEELGCVKQNINCIMNQAKRKIYAALY